MEIINDIEQGSDEWLKLRLGVATASNFSRIITGGGKTSASAKDYAKALVSEMLLDQLEDRYKGYDMARGNELEPEALAAYQEYSFNVVEKVSFISCGDYGYSPDGLIGNDGLVEIKCPAAEAHTKYMLENKLPDKYKAQVQGGLFVSERKWCDFISYHPLFKEGYKLFIKRVYRDEEFISKLESGIMETIRFRNLDLAEIRSRH